MNNDDKQWSAQLLGQILLDNSVLEKSAFSSLHITDFLDCRHAIIFWSAQGLLQQGKAATFTAIAENLRERDLLEYIGGEDFLCKFAAMVVAQGWETVLRSGVNRREVN
jgi:replicative DNA helicase